MPVFNPPSGGGGSSVPGLPVWTYDPSTSGAPASGHFQFDNASFPAAAMIYFNKTAKTGGLDYESWFNGMATHSIINLADSAGKVYAFSAAGSGGVVSNVASIVGSAIISDAIALSGDYQVSFTPVAFAPTLGEVLSASGISPAGDATVTPVTSLSTTSGIVTSAS